jgi:hypothetical protein
MEDFHNFETISKPALDRALTTWLPDTTGAFASISALTIASMDVGPSSGGMSVFVFKVKSNSLLEVV